MLYIVTINIQDYKIKTARLISYREGDNVGNMIDSGEEYRNYIFRSKTQAQKVYNSFKERIS